MPQIKNRKPTRLKNYNYSENGFYFVTICTKNREEFFGNIEHEKMNLNEYGEIAKNCWLEIPNHFPYCVLDEFIIMPNHVHGILVIKNDDAHNNSTDNPAGKPAGKPVGNRHACSLQSQSQSQQNRQYQKIPIIIGSFKSAITKIIHKKLSYFGWQKSFHDHIICNEKSLYNIRNYIVNNPFKWDLDENNLNIFRN
ncbi:MAG: hypothetical protein WCK16_00035 [Candidatus Moraniibacteriota bacterium]